MFIPIALDKCLVQFYILPLPPQMILPTAALCAPLPPQMILPIAALCARKDLVTGFNA